MAESIKQRVGGMKIGKMSQKELLKILTAMQSDLAANKTLVTTVRADLVNIQTTANALVLDAHNLANNTGSANNTVQITATAATVSTTNAAALNTTT